MPGNLTFHVTDSQVIVDVVLDIVKHLIAHLRPDMELSVELARNEDVPTIVSAVSVAIVFTESLHC